MLPAITSNTTTTKQCISGKQNVLRCPTPPTSGFSRGGNKEVRDQLVYNGVCNAVVCSFHPSAVPVCEYRPCPHSDPIQSMSTDLIQTFTPLSGLHMCSCLHTRQAANHHVFQQMLLLSLGACCFVGTFLVKLQHGACCFGSMYTINNKGGAEFCPTFIPCVASHSAGWSAVPGLKLALCKHGKHYCLQGWFYVPWLLCCSSLSTSVYDSVREWGAGGHCKRVIVGLLMMITPKLFVEMCSLHLLCFASWLAGLHLNNVLMT